jgi:serine/threonine-protein kinase
MGALDLLLTLPPDERARKLAELAATTPDVHARVSALLEADGKSDLFDFLENPRPAAVQADSRLGPYRILRRVGSGGMGEVWLARRDDGLYEGEVAIKTLHPWFAFGAMRERFLREAQFLGKLAHPNIARLLDAGTADGVVYLVLEYVQGQALDEYCDANALGIEQRIRLIQQVCAAVSQAHARLVVHRDIKPGNILVTAAGEVKLLDFGIGKLVEYDAPDDRGDITRVTGRVFTPEFAAPEQVRGETIGTAADIYSLGMLLYVLLAGARPYGDATGIRLEHAVLHEEPEFLGIAAGRAAAPTASARGTSPRRLRRLLSGDLENIVHRALRKDPAQRYASVQALSEDLTRYQRHEAVSARSGSRTYRMERFVRRHRLALALSLGAVLAAAAGVVGILYQAREAREQARLARIEADKANSVKDYLLSIFEANSAEHPDGVAARQTTAEELMDIATRQVLADETKNPEVRIELMSVLHNILNQMEKYAELEALGVERIRLTEQAFGVSDVRLSDAWNDHSEFLRGRQRRDEARIAALKAVELREAQGDRSSWTRGVSEVQLGQLAYDTWAGEGEEPVAHFEKAIGILGKLPPDHQLVRAQLGLARSLELLQRFDEAIVANERGIALATQVDGPRANAVAGGHQQLSRVLLKTFRFDEAERHLALAVDIFTFLHGPDNGFTTLAKLDVGRTQIRRENFRDALVGLESVLATRTRIDGPDNPWTQQTRNALAEAAFGYGDFTRTQAVLDENLASIERSGNARLRPGVRRQLAVLSLARGRPAEALRLLEEAAALSEGTALARTPLSYLLEINRAEALTALGRQAEARAALEKAVPLLAEFDLDPEKSGHAAWQLMRSRVELAEGNAEAARASTMQVLEKLRASPRRAEMWTLEELANRRLADAELALGHRVPACAALDQSIRLRGANAHPADPRLAGARKLQASCSR